MTSAALFVAEAARIDRKIETLTEHLTILSVAVLSFKTRQVARKAHLKSLSRSGIALVAAVPAIPTIPAAPAWR
jgi:hypothetical protein